jgi:hypothetical protein
MQKFIISLAKLVGGALVVSSTILWALSYFEVDISGVMSFFGVNQTLLGGITLTGIVTWLNFFYTKLMQLQTISIIQQYSSASINQSVLTQQELDRVLVKFSDVEQQLIKDHASQKAIKTLLLLHTEFESILAKKNETSELLSDEVKTQIKLWNRKRASVEELIKREII